MERLNIHISKYLNEFSSKGSVRIADIIESHAEFEPLLHRHAGSSRIDVNALTYCLFRLPLEIFFASRINISPPEVDADKMVSPRARRAQWAVKRVDNKGVDNVEELSIIARSWSDIHDTVANATILQIEWNKMRSLLRQFNLSNSDADSNASSAIPTNSASSSSSTNSSGISWDDAKRAFALDEDKMLQLDLALHRNSMALLNEIKARELDLTIVLDSRLISPESQSAGFEKLSRDFSANVQAQLNALGLAERKIIIVSSNLHSIANLLSGFASAIETRLISFVHESHDKFLIKMSDSFSVSNADKAVAAIAAGASATKEVPETSNNAKTKNSAGNPTGNSTKQDFLYYVSKKYISKNNLQAERLAWEEKNGIYSFSDSSGSNVPFQIMDLARINGSVLDSRIKEFFAKIKSCTDDVLSGYAIVNIDYPFGMQAKHIMQALLERFRKVSFVIIMGKAGGFAGKIGDIVIPSVVVDDSSPGIESERKFRNLIEKQYFPREIYHGVIENAKGLTSKGTVIINKDYLEAKTVNDVIFIEMEAGQFLSALSSAGFNEAGLVYYISDMPLKGESLSQNLSFSGAHTTYSASAAVLNCIFSSIADREQNWR